MPQPAAQQASSSEQTAAAFVTLAAHQFKTPIAELRGYVDNLLHGTAGDLTEQQFHYLMQMQTVCERTAHLVDNLLDISQIELGVITMNLTPVDVRQLVDGALHGFERDIATKDLKLTIQQGEKEIIVFADPVRTTEVLKNVIQNAIKFTEKGGIEVTIDQKGPWGRITIADTGIGLSPSARQELFQRSGILGRPFMSGQGAGLGLCVASQFVAFENGTIDLLPSKKGATFRVELPLFTATTPLGQKVRPAAIHTES